MTALDRFERAGERNRSLPGGLAGNATVRRLALFGAPIGAAIAMWIHPHAGNDVYASLSPVVDRWVGAHLLLFGSLAGLAVGLYLLLAGYRSVVATVARIGIGAFALLYLAFVAVVGVTSGLLIREAQSLSAEQQAGVAAVVEYLHTDPLLFWAGALGAVGYLVAVSGTAVVYARDGAPKPALAALVGSTVALAAHSDLVAVAGMALFLVGVGWLEFGWDGTGRTDRTRAGAAGGDSP